MPTTWSVSTIRSYVGITYSSNAPPLRIIFVKAISQVTEVISWWQRRCDWLSIQIICAKNLMRFTGCAVRKLVQVIIEAIGVVHLGRAKSVSADPYTAEQSCLRVAEQCNSPRCYASCANFGEYETVLADAVRWQSESRLRNVMTARRCRSRPNGFS